jgi:hypothetical protein
VKWMKLWALLPLLLAPPAFAARGVGEPSPSACHIFIDHQFIWTLEILRSPGGRTTPVLNIVTLAAGQWDLRPRDLHLINEQNREAEIGRFSLDTGVTDDPYYLHYLKVQGNSFIGMDLIGDFQGFERLREAVIELEEIRFTLEPIDCLEFERVAHQINQINYDSPDIREDFEVLRIPFRGKREVRRRYY